MKTLMSRLGYTFRDESLLQTALTHPSCSGERHVANYQRLEFLGDAVLQLAISRFLSISRSSRSQYSGQASSR